jgi:hypothetical protein
MSSRDHGLSRPAPAPYEVPRDQGASIEELVNVLCTPYHEDVFAVLAVTGKRSKDVGGAEGPLKFAYLLPELPRTVLRNYLYSLLGTADVQICLEAINQFSRPLATVSLGADGCNASPRGLRINRLLQPRSQLCSLYHWRVYAVVVAARSVCKMKERCAMVVPGVFLSEERCWQSHAQRRLALQRAAGIGTWHLAAVAVALAEASPTCSNPPLDHQPIPCLCLALQQLAATNFLPSTGRHFSPRPISTTTNLHRTLSSFLSHLIPSYPIPSYRSFLRGGSTSTCHLPRLLLLVLRSII